MVEATSRDGWQIHSCIAVSSRFSTSGSAAWSNSVSKETTKVISSEEKIKIDLSKQINVALILVVAKDCVEIAIVTSLLEPHD